MSLHEQSHGESFMALARNDSQLIIATHSVIISALPDADVYEITEKGINKTEYVKTSHYNIMKHFVNSPEKMVSDLTGKER